MDSKENTLQFRSFLLGLPSAGKTTFLAALWHTLDSSEVEGAFTLGAMPEEAQYLNQIREDWANVEELPRTHLSSTEIIEIELIRSTTGSRFQFVVPDLSGEKFEQQWSDRQIEPEFRELIRQSGGGILMIHPAENCREPLFIGEVSGMVDALSGDLEDTSATSVESALNDWEPKLAPTQVKLVDLLQIIQSQSSKKSIRLSVVVSAWDLLKDNQQSPEEWLQVRMPLLHQFLQSNSDYFAFKIFGLSALGGTMDDAEKLREYSRASQRVFVETDGETNGTITDLVDWVLPQENE